MAEETSQRARGWIRRYPVLTIVCLLVLFILLSIMPSALNQPQSNPTTVLEYAPIPPEDEDEPPPQDGSLSSLSLGSSDTIETGAQDEEDETPPETKISGEGEEPIAKRCVGNPPRQTEDPNAPPCVPFFSGDNGGATFRGVTKDEIKIVVYRDGHMSTGGDTGTESTPPSGEICDIDSAPNDTSNIGCTNGEGTQDHNDVGIVRALSKYFNERFQTYDRHVHFYIYWSPATGAAGRRSDVQDIYERIGPYAAIDYTIFGDAQAFIEASVKREMTIYGSYAALPNRIYRENAPYLWSFWPDVEHGVSMYHDYICKRVAPFKVSNSGNANDMGKERKYGLLYTTDAAYPGHRTFAQLAEQKLRSGCPNGAELDIVGEYTYPRNGWGLDTNPEESAKADENIARMRTDGVTTVLWLSGYEVQHSRAASDTNYLPEWVLAGDVQNDQTEENQFGATGGQTQEAWRHAWVMSNHLREDKRAEVPCRQAMREGDPFASPEDELSACALYRSFFMLFRGIQVAGPFLTPDSVDQGNHSIARQESNDPYVASCFYDPGDFTCVKDAQESWWDPDAPDPNQSTGQTGGCWRMNNNGLRHLAGTWPQGNEIGKTANAPCNSVSDNGYAINPYGPAG